jgi:hypothetical protein
MKPTIITTNDANYSLHNIDNFKKFMETNQSDILNKYIEIITEYLIFFLANNKIKNKNYFNFIIVRGIETITHVFNTILYYTKNTSITYLHSQKAYYFYIEFIGQITEDHNAFLQLSSKDAITYVYKKTIFEINSEYTGCLVEEELSKFKYVSEHIILLKNVFEILITNISSSNNNDNNNNDNEKIDLCSKLCFKLVQLKIDVINLPILHTFFELLQDKYKVKFDDFYNIVILFFKKIGKNVGFIKKIKTKFYDDQFELLLVNETHDKFINWLIL